MRLFIAILLIALLSLLAEHHFAWWSVAVVSFLVAFVLSLRPNKGFLAGFTGVGIMWLVAVLAKDIPNHHILSRKMAELFHLPNYMLFILVTVLIGALVGGIAGWSGSILRNAFR